jgi:hypothetical protein
MKLFPSAVAHFLQHSRKQSHEDHTMLGLTELPPFDGLDLNQRPLSKISCSIRSIQPLRRRGYASYPVLL